jgi:uncharacterized OB-fold protein
MAADIQHPKPGLDWETRAYWEGAGRGELVLQRCGDCGTTQHRPRGLCVSCLSDAIEHFVASGRGTVYTYTITNQNQAPGFREAVPYVLAYVELEEGVRLLTTSRTTAARASRATASGSASATCRSTASC